MKYVALWTRSHIDDGDRILKKPIMFTEFGYSTLNKDFDPLKRDRFFKTIFDVIYKSAKKQGAGAGSFVWQFLVGGMEKYNDDFGIVPWERPETYKLITQHSCRMVRIRGSAELKGNLKELCSQR